MATAEEDFTFPNSSPPRFLDSPPLWRRSTASRHEGEDVERIFNFPSFQELRGSTSDHDHERNCTISHDEGDQDQEKMDLLWEDLNDDQFSRNRGKAAEEDSDISSPRREEQVQIKCVKTLKLSKAKVNGHIISGKKTSILVFIKVLKKVFLMHNSQRGIKKSSW